MGSRERVELVLAGADEHDLTKLAEYREVGGYKPLAKARKLEPQAIVDELLASDLRGRGGAGFPMGRKASFLAEGHGQAGLPGRQRRRVGARRRSRTARSCSASRTG